MGIEAIMKTQMIIDYFVFNLYLIVFYCQNRQMIPECKHIHLLFFSKLSSKKHKFLS